MTAFDRGKVRTTSFPISSVGERAQRETKNATFADSCLQYRKQISRRFLEPSIFSGGVVPHRQNQALLEDQGSTVSLKNMHPRIGFSKRDVPRRREVKLKIKTVTERERAVVFEQPLSFNAAWRMQQQHLRAGMAADSSGLHGEGISRRAPPPDTKHSGCCRWCREIKQVGDPSQCKMMATT